MARLVDHIAAPPRKPEVFAAAPDKVKTVTTEKAKIAVAENDHDDGDNDSIPFIEIGGPDTRSKQSMERPSRPAIIPMTRAEVKLPVPPIPAAPATNFYRVSFQPLPVRDWVALPQDKRLATELVAFHDPNHAVSMQYQSIVHSMEAELSGFRSRVVLLSALQKGIGTTSVLLNLALTCAKQGQRVLVADASFAQPGIAERLSVAPAPGLREALARTMPAMWSIQETAEPTLFAIAAGQNPLEPPLDLLPALLDQLRQRFDWIFVDAGEWVQRPEKRALLTASTAAYLVLTPGDLESPIADNMLGEIGVHGGKLRGYVMVHR
jgi:Mrp family chromosome partitioning ATPase